jgi:hypothetical protein
VVIVRRSLPPDSAPDEPDPEEIGAPVARPDVMAAEADEQEPEAPDVLGEREPALD